MDVSLFDLDKREQLWAFETWAAENSCQRACDEVSEVFCDAIELVLAETSYRDWGISAEVSRIDVENSLSDWEERVRDNPARELEGYAVYLQDAYLRGCNWPQSPTWGGFVDDADLRNEFESGAPSLWITPVVDEKLFLDCVESNYAALESGVLPDYLTWPVWFNGLSPLNRGDDRHWGQYASLVSCEDDRDCCFSLQGFLQKAFEQGEDWRHDALYWAEAYGVYYLREHVLDWFSGQKAYWLSTLYEDFVDDVGSALVFCDDGTYKYYRGKQACCRDLPRLGGVFSLIRFKHILSQKLYHVMTIR